MASGKNQKIFQSKKVGQTLQDLEAAFADWEALSDSPAAPESAETAAAKQSAHPNAHSNDIREKTKKLLHQLREQLAELAD